MPAKRVAMRKVREILRLKLGVIAQGGRAEPAPPAGPMTSGCLYRAQVRLCARGRREARWEMVVPHSRAG